MFPFALRAIARQWCLQLMWDDEDGVMRRDE